MNLYAWLLHLANADTSLVTRDGFYRLKERLLERYATREPDDLQEITDSCLGPYPHHGCPGSQCRKCGGTGIYRQAWVRLASYRWGKYVFHWPLDRTTIRPSAAPTIVGRIVHHQVGRVSAEAVCWLYLLCGEWRLLARELRGHCFHGWYLWPMLTIQRIVMPAAIYCRWRRCWCGRLFWTRGTGWQICRTCRRRDDEEIREAAATRRACERPNCSASAIACYLPGEQEVHEWLCGDHAREAGHCVACGQFVAGSDEEYDCQRTTLCEHCRADVDSDDDVVFCEDAPF